VSRKTLRSTRWRYHDAYHHGQIKLALKLAGLALNDEVAGPGTWGVWMERT
jgi:hypothetical protein